MGALSFITYILTTAPVVAFWDNGEFIAVGYTLGIGHPPGSPVYTLLTRLFGLLPFPNVAVAINFMSVIAGALAVSFFYFALAKMARRWEGEIRSFADGLPTYITGITASCFIAFSFSFWENALEAEVYATNILIMAATLWLVLRWSELGSAPRTRKHLYLVFYLLALGVGIHMGSLLWAPAFLVFMILFERNYIGSVLLAIPLMMGFVLMSKNIEWWRGPLAMWLIGLGLAVFYAIPVLWPTPVKLPKRSKAKVFVPALPTWLWGSLVVIEVLLLFATLSRHGGSAAGLFVLALAISAAAIYCFMHLTRIGVIDRPQVPARALLAALSLTLIALSVHAYLLIRARLNPAINESDPRTWKIVFEVMRRAQYEPMRFFPRRTPLLNQFRIVWGYHKMQFSSSSNPIAIIAPYLLALWGFIAHARKDRRTFTMMAIAFGMASLGLLMYLNISDHEVRSREYFWVPSYVGLALWMGIGSGAIVEWAKELGKHWRNLLAVAVVIFALMPFIGNFQRNDRSDNYVAYYYGWNMLSFLDEDAILITNGDNDTFPLWYLQQVENLRPDVDVVNLSLIQINWYLKQLKDRGVPLSFTYEQIEEMHPYWVRDPQTQQLSLVTLRDLGIHDIIATNEFRRPIYFAVTVDNFMGYYDNLELEGMVFKLTTKTGRHMVNEERTWENVFDNYRYDSIVDVNDDWRVVDTVKKSASTARLITNYAAGFSRLGFAAMQDPDRTDEAIMLYTRALKFAPDYGPALNGLVALYAARLLQPEKALPFAERLVASQPDLMEAWVRYGGVHLMLAEGFQRHGETEEAQPHYEIAMEAYEHVLNMEPQRYDLYPPLLTIYQTLGKADKLNSLMEMWRMYGPTDESEPVVK
jgi:tetratricopeptide (TPR) repeat protein